jgi:predicted Holliday junction resolvase-like endonuclease
MPGVVETFQAFSGILVICPCCGALLRLSDLNLRYTGKFERTVLDTLRQHQKALERKQGALNKKEERFDAREGQLREAAARRGRQRVKKLIHKIDPSMSKLPYAPQDIKVMSYPVDLIVFDGLEKGDKVKNVIFIARSKVGSARGLRRSVAKALEKGNYIWETVRVGVDGAVEVANK